MNNIDKVKNNVKHDAKDLYEETQDKASNLYDEMRNKTESVSQQVKETVSDIYEEGKKKVTQAEDLVCEYSDSLIKIIKDKPLTSVLVATGFGLFLSKLLKK